MNLVRFHDLLSCPFRIYLRRWESQNVLAYDFFLIATKKKKGTTLNLIFHQFSPCANINLCQPSPTSCPLKCTLWHNLSCCRWSSVAKDRWRNGAIVKIILGQTTGQNPKLVLLEIAWLSPFYHLALHGEHYSRTYPNDKQPWHSAPRGMQSGERVFSIFAKLRTRGYVNVNKSVGWGNRVLM